MRIDTSRSSHRTLILRRRLAIAAAAICLAASPASATDYSWDAGFGLQYWDAPQNWNPDGVPTITSLVTFPTLASDYSVASPLTGGRDTNAVTFDTTNQVDISYSLAPLVINSGTLTRTAASSGEQTISSAVILNANAVWNINGSGQLSANMITEKTPGTTFTKTGNGVLSLLSTSGWTGATTIVNGILRTGNGLGVGSLSVSSTGTIEPIAFVSHPLTLGGAGFGGLGALRNEGGANGWSGPITLNTNGTIGVDDGTLTVSGVIDDGINTRNLTKAGAGTLVLSKANTYNGTTTISAGILSVTNSSALGTGAVSVSSGAGLSATDGLTISNSAIINGNGPASVGAISNQSGSVTYAGSITLQSNSAIGSTAGELLITGPLSGNFVLSKVGAGTVTLPNAGSTGALAVVQGILKIRNAAAINTAGAAVFGGSLALQETLGGGLPLNINRPLILDGGDAVGGGLRNISAANTWSGSVTLQSNGSIGVDADSLTIGGAIGGSFNLTKVGPGSLVLTNVSNTYGNTNLDGGYLDMTVPAALPVGGIVTVHDGATLRMQGGLTGIRTLALNGSGMLGGGALSSTSGTNQWNAPATLQTQSAIGVDAGELRMLGAIGGASGIDKVGAGKLTLAAANTYTGTSNVNAGILSVEDSSGLFSASTTNVSVGAAVEVRGGVSPNGALVLNGTGILNTGALRNPAGTNTWAGPITLNTADATIGVDSGSQLTIGNPIGDGSSVFPLTKVGAGTLVLTFPNSYEGGTLINGGTIRVSGDSALGALSGKVTTNNGGKLVISSSFFTTRTFNLNNGSLQVEAGATLQYSNATVNGGFLRGPGTHQIGGNSFFNGVTALAGNTILQTATTTLNNFANSGVFTSNGALTWDGGYNTSAGSIAVNNTFNTTAFENTGTININNGGNLSNTANNFVSGGGSRININAGGQLNVTGNALDLNGALLVNNGTITGTTNVNFGSLAKGSGVYGAVNVTDGGKFSPGNSPGSVTTGSTTWNSGGSYQVEIDTAAHDYWQIDGILKLDATTLHPFVVSLASIDGLIFDATHDHTWPILHAADGIAGLDLSALLLDSSAFKNSLGTGHFSLDSTSSDLAIHFSSVPEPSAIAVCLATALISNRRRWRRQPDRKKV